MLRIRAVRRLLVEDVAGLAVGGVSSHGPDPESEREAVEEAGRKAISMAVLALFALATFLLLYDREPRLWRFVGAESVLSLVLLAIAGLGGFRLGQWEKYRAVRRVLEGLGKGRSDAEAS